MPLHTRPVLGTLVAVLLLAISRAYPAGPLPSDVQRLQGTWDVVYYEKNGQRATPAALEQLPPLLFVGTQYFWLHRTTASNGTFTVQERDGTINYTYTSGEKKGQTFLGVYLLQGDLFIDCFAEVGLDRPQAFTTSPNSGHTLVVYRRRKE